jgi:hypothetical protein
MSVNFIKNNEVKKMYGKNSEGYADPTATEAIARVMKWEKTIKNRPKSDRIIYVASAYRGNVQLNTERTKRYCRFVINKGCVPFAPHLLYTQFLNDNDKDERQQGLAFGNAILAKCNELWAFGSITNGMLGEIETAAKLGITVKYFNTKCEEIV